MDKGGISIIMFPPIKNLHKKKKLSKGENIILFPILQHFVPHGL
jgi:hypothetical protein